MQEGFEPRPNPFPFDVTSPTPTQVTNFKPELEDLTEVPITINPNGEIQNGSGLPAASRYPTESEFRKLRGQFFTVRHQIVAACGHKYDPTRPPRHANCQECWFAWLNEHGELVQSLDEAYQEHGIAVIEKTQGRQVARAFLKFMATLAKLQEANERSTQGFGDSSGAGTETTRTETRTEDDGRALEGDLGGREVAEQGV